MHIIHFDFQNNFTDYHKGFTLKHQSSVDNVGKII